MGLETGSEQAVGGGDILMESKGRIQTADSDVGPEAEPIPLAPQKPSLGQAPGDAPR